MTSLEAIKKTTGVDDMTLSQIIGTALKSRSRLEQERIEKEKKYARSCYIRFRKTVRKLQTSYMIAPDGYLDIEPFEGFPKGISVFHFNWPETLEKIEYALDHPESLDDGIYAD
ncbi:MAG: hypothetical protein EBY38_02905 [Flavobacteriaceae bacterium]|nr:hypothetical protein [Flavobacteriaceae bacterium]